MGEMTTPWVRPPQRQPTIDPADFVALKVVTQALLATMAAQIEAAGGPNPQDWLNHLSACCQEAIASSDLTDGRDAAAFRNRVANQVNRTLAGVQFPPVARLEN